jgi:hypothetical protein
MSNASGPIDRALRFALRFSAAALIGLSIACGGSGGRPGGASPPGASPRGTTTSATGTADACSLLAESEIAEVVKNPVQPGRPAAGPEVCDWDTDDPASVDVLLTVRLKGSTRAEVLCDEIRKGQAAGGVVGIGEAVSWEFSASSLFNSGELQVCDAKGYVSVSLNGKADDPTLKSAASALAAKVLARL